MRKYWVAIASSLLTGLLVMGGLALAQAPGIINSYVGVCNPDFPDRCVKPNPDGSVNVSGSISATSAATATSSAPTYSEGVSEPLSQTLSGSLRVDCTSGCSGGGSQSNASSGVATSSDNNKSVSWLYGFNGTSWDQLQVDASKYLKVAVQAGTAVIGHVITDSGSVVAATQSGSWNVGQSGSPWGVTGSGSAGSPATGVVTVQGIPSGSPVAGNVTFLGSAAINLGSGTIGTGTQRMTVATDQGALPAWGLGATAAAVPSGAQYTAANKSGNLTGLVMGSANDLTVGGAGTAGSASGGVLSVQGVASMTPVQVSQATASNLNAQVTGTGSAGSPASGVVTVQGIASGTPQTINLTQIGGNSISVGSGTNGTGVQRVTIATDQGGIAALGTGATGSAVPSGAQYQGMNVGGNLTGLITCNAVAKYDASTSGSTQLVALQSGQTIRICGYTFLAAGTVNVKLVYGTGSNCVTSPSDITPAYQLVAQAGLVDREQNWQGLATAASNALCINASGAVAVQALVYYTQF